MYYAMKTCFMPNSKVFYNYSAPQKTTALKLHTCMPDIGTVPKTDIKSTAKEPLALITY